MRRPLLVGFTLWLFWAFPAYAQEQDQKSGKVADSAAGQAGQRMTRDQNAAKVEPMARLETRIANRVQSRIRNRIDRYYDPKANATSPFVDAGEQAAKAGRRPRR